ncbi:TonB-dependent receptor [Bowmanella dokdonensis]|uniref:TonB-dependent receptor n=1 Tax=Bowmanella dokdonensis TaxID=751969 RepID=A0A939DMJ0_9ALTE|nr:TonB-dependent receptor [Bowmanella dokdonensis]
MLCFCALTPPVAAETTPQQWERISVTARQPANKGQQPLSVSRIAQTDIALFQAVHINELLNQVQGTWISRGNGQEHLTAIRSPVLTGAGSCGAFLVSEDGIPTRASGFCNANQLFELNTEQAGAVEVLRGPASSGYGSNAVHGVINVVSPTVPDSPMARLGLETGPHDFLRGSFALGTGNLLFYGNLAHDGGYQDDSGYQQQKVNLIHRHQQGDWQGNTRLALTNLNQETAGYVQGLDAYRDPALRRSNDNPEAYRDARSARLSSDWHLETAPGHSLTLTPYLRFQDMQFLQHYLPWQATEQNNQRGVGLQGRYRAQTELLSWTLGLDTEWTDGELVETQAQDFAPSIPAGRHYDYQVIARNLSPYASIAWTLRSDLELTASLRYDWQQYDYQTRLPTGSVCAPQVESCRFFRPASQQVDYHQWSPSTGLVWQFADTHQFYLQLSRGYRAPQATELFRLQAGQQVAELDAEQMDSLELGLRGQTGALSYEFSLYHMQKDNVIFQDTERQNVSNGKTRHQGLEALLNWQPGEHWYARISGSWARHQYRNNPGLAEGEILGNDMDTAPRLMANARLGWQQQSYRLELEWNRMGAYFLDPQNSAEYPGHSLLNLRGNWQLSDGWTLSARLLNLTDRDYAERADIGFGQYRYFVGEPRSLYLSVAWSG